MFRPFSFDGASRPPSDLAVDYCSDISPTTTLASPADAIHSLSDLSCASIGDLQRQFDQQRLDNKASYWNNAYCNIASPPPPSFDDPVCHDVDPSCALHGIPSLSVRSRRQLNTRLQCSSVHVEKISSLVERMISHGEQCSVRPTCDPVLTLEYDSGDDSGVDCDPQRTAAQETPLPKFKYRRSADYRDGSTCVMKSVRQRRRKDISKRKPNGKS